MAKTKPLTAKEQVFIDHFLIHHSKTKAALAAGAAERSAGPQGYVIFNRPHVQVALKKALKEQQARTLITADQVLLDINNLAERAAHEGEYAAAIRGKELIGKHYKLFTEKHEHGGLGGGPVQLQITEKEADL